MEQGFKKKTKKGKMKERKHIPFYKMIKKVSSAISPWYVSHHMNPVSSCCVPYCSGSCRPPTLQCAIPQELDLTSIHIR